MEQLPDEVLARVFHYVLLADIVTGVQTVPLVCRRWRRALREGCRNVRLMRGNMSASLWSA